MANRSISDEELKFRKRARRRLIGAIALVVVVIVIVPWILPENKPQQDNQQIDIRIPAQDASGYVPKILPVEQAHSPAAQPSAENAKPAESAVAQIDKTPLPANTAKEPAPAAGNDTEAAKPAVQENSKKDDKPKAKNAQAEKPKAAATQPAAGSVLLQFGAYSKMVNARQRQAELKAKGVSSYTEVVKTTDGDKIRVRSGPYATRQEAEKIREKTRPLDSKVVVVGNKN